MDANTRFFETPAAFRAWLRKNHAKAAELHVGYFRTRTGRRSMTWPESVAEALCFGWVDGIRRKIDDQRYSVRFTPRAPSYQKKTLWWIMSAKRDDAKDRRLARLVDASTAGKRLV